MAKLKNAPVALIIMDGCGLGGKLDKSNAVEAAKTPVLDGLLANYNSSHLQASGEFVGLPDGQMGNSEVGHTNIGAGRLVYQQLTRITRDIKNGDFFKNEALLSIMQGAKEKGGAVHLMGLVSPGGVHSHQDHLYALLEMAKREGVKDVYVHAFLDGRDVPPQSAQPYLEELEAKCKEIGVGTIATVSGRYYAMDRDHRWDREQKAYEAIAHAEGVASDSAVAGLKASYANDVNDEFVVPFVVKGYEGMKNGDGAIFFNFRPDRARQLTHAFTDETFDGFERDESLKIPFTTFSQYEDGMNAKVAFPPELDRQKDLAYLAHVAFPKSVPSPKREWILAVYHRVLSGELEKYPKNFFLAQESDLYLAVCMQDALNRLPVSRTADLYDYFADEEKGWSFLKKACLYTPAHNFYDYPIDVLHASLEPDQRSELDYHYGRFCCDMKRQKRKRRYRACASESTAGT